MMETPESKVHCSEDVLKFASDAGRVLLENGAEISRVEETMERIAENYGESGEKFFVLSNGIFTRASPMPMPNSSQSRGPGWKK